MTIQETHNINQSKTRLSLMYIATLILGFIGFAAPAVFFQMGNMGGYKGVNFTVIALCQFIIVVPLIYFALRKMNASLRTIGLTAKFWKKDALYGAAFAVVWALIQFFWLIPATGGAARPDVAAMLDMIDGRFINVLWYLPLGIIGGGITEEIYNRGFTIVGLSNILGNSKSALAIASVFAILFFAALHFPADAIEWIDLLIPSTAYTVLFLVTGRLTAPIVAHSLWNTIAIVVTYLIYV